MYKVINRCKWKTNIEEGPNKTSLELLLLGFNKEGPFLPNVWNLKYEREYSAAFLLTLRRTPCVNPNQRRHLLPPPSLSVPATATIICCRFLCGQPPTELPRPVLVAAAEGTMHTGAGRRNRRAHHLHLSLSRFLLPRPKLLSITSFQSQPGAVMKEGSPSRILEPQWRRKPPETAPRSPEIFWQPCSGGGARFLGL